MVFRRRRTIRFRITVVATLVVALVLSVTGVVLVIVQREQLLSNLESTLERRADELQAGSDGPSASDEDRFEQVLDAGGTVIASSPNLAGAPAVVAVPDDTGQSFRDLEVPEVDEDEFRVVVRRVENGEVLVVGETSDDLRDSVRILSISLLIAIPLVVGSLAALIWWLVGRTLRPVEAIRSEVADISATELHRRVPEPDTGDEVARLADTMNLMLDRIEGSTRLQRQFVADASHELRSPLTRIRTELEVDGTHESVLEEVVSMQRLVEDLMLLARSDGGAVAPRNDPVDLDDVVHREVKRLRADTEVAIDMSAVSGAMTRGNEEHLARVIRNLVENAVDHADAAVEVSLRETDRRAVLVVDDDGTGIPAGERDHVFERFTRLDEARSRHAGGSGLGLAIARDIVTGHGGTITVSDSPLGGARFVVKLPAVES